MQKFVVIFSILIVSIEGGHEGDRCTLQQLNGASGICTQIRQCPHAIAQLQRKIRPQLCGFLGFDPIVCCPQAQTETATQNHQPSPVPLRKLGSISEQKCLYYRKKPLDRPAVFHISVVGGEEATAKEFPHMAVLGYGEPDSIQWLCGGTLVSENFILTAAHCLQSPQVGKVKYVRLGDINIRNANDESDPQNFEIARVFAHPDYLPSSKYNDIALLQLNQSIEFSEYVKPACLDTKGVPTSPDYELLATGWGKTQFTGPSSDVLLKVGLSLYTNENCRNVYGQSQKGLPNSIVDGVQLCAGGVDEQKDTCQGDSGGPLQYLIENVFPKQYVIVGVTSFGKGCGVQNIPGVYTRVQPYVSWIENIVWPN